MIRFITTLVFSLAFGLCLPAQRVQWASSVNGFSSQYSAYKYGAQQILGKPNVLPAYMDSPCAWSSELADAKSNEYIRVGFAEPMQIRQIAIAESFNPGGITKVLLIDEQGKEYNIYENAHPGPLSVPGRLFKLKVALTTFKVKEAKIILDATSVPGFAHIDAIGISDSEVPIVAEIRVSKEFEFASSPQALNGPINSEHDDMIPVAAEDGNLLYFCRNETGGKVGQEIWSARKTSEGHWMDPVHLEGAINNKGHNVLCAIFNNGQSALLENIYRTDGEMDFGLSVATNINGVWRNFKALDVKNYYNRNKFGEAFMTADGKMLLLSVERDDSKQSIDLYVSFESNGSYSEPKNLGPDVNSTGSETAPFLAADGKTLFFASNGRSGFGSKDIYVTRRLDETWTHWSEPENIGPQVNSAEYESHFKISPQGDVAYFSRQAFVDRKMDIFEIAVPIHLQQHPASTQAKPVLTESTAIVTGKLLDATTKAPITGLLTYQLEGSPNLMGTINLNNVEDAYRIVLPLKAKYRLTAKAAGYLNATIVLDLSNETQPKSLQKDLALKPQ